jgi:sugar phosphate isomerase/epimerase
MQLGFVTAILPDLPFREVLRFASDTGYDCVEVMCWPPGKAERRYAGVTHLDFTDLSEDKVNEVIDQINFAGVGISGLGYYPNVLSPIQEEASLSINHLKTLIEAAPKLGLVNVNTFIGRDRTLSVEENWPRFLEVWRPIIELAEKNGVKIGIENCPMLFTKDEWPGGKNLMTSPVIWEGMFNDIPSDFFGLNFDPSHFIWQQMDYLSAMKTFSHKLFHIHAKDVKMNWEKLANVGIMAHPNDFHTPKIPGLGDVDWDGFFLVLNQVGYEGPVCVEVEDRSFEDSLEGRKDSLIKSYQFLKPFFN